MKEGYVPKDQRKKILLMCDDIRAHSGIANVAKELVIGTAHKYNWINLGGAVKHPEEGQVFDISDNINPLSGITDSDVKVIASTGYGNPTVVRQLIQKEQPDAIFLITDPRYWDWLFNIENEIRRKIPIIYLNIWDDYPAPMYNKAFYESCDVLLGISKQTVNINKLVLGDKADNKIIKYVPHGINETLYYPITEYSSHFEKYSEFANNVTNGGKDFVLFFNSRNIRRKQIPDTLLAWKYFIDQLPQEKQDKCLFILHTQPVDQHGTDLFAVRDYLFGEDCQHVAFSQNRIGAEQLNYFYNIADAQILLTSNEGWGLSITEAMHAGTPVIANVTGGMQDQMRFVDEDGNWYTPDADIPSNHTGRYKEHGEWAFPVYPTNRSLQGSVPTPYIWDDRCKPEDASEQIMKLYNMTREERKKLGFEGRKWALGDEAGFTTKHMGDRVIDAMEEMFETWTPREKFELIKVTTKKEKLLKHKLLY